MLIHNHGVSGAHPSHAAGEGRSQDQGQIHQAPKQKSCLSATGQPQTARIIWGVLCNFLSFPHKLHILSKSHEREMQKSWLRERWNGWHFLNLEAAWRGGCVLILPIGRKPAAGVGQDDDYPHRVQIMLILEETLAIVWMRPFVLPP